VCVCYRINLSTAARGALKYNRRSSSSSSSRRLSLPLSSLTRAPTPWPCEPSALWSWRRQRLCCSSMMQFSSCSRPPRSRRRGSKRRSEGRGRGRPRALSRTTWRLTRSVGRAFLFFPRRGVFCRTFLSLSFSLFPPWTGRTSFVSLWRRCRRRRRRCRSSSPRRRGFG